MTKSRLSLRNLARADLSLFILLFLFSGCSLSTAPTFSNKNIEESLQKICVEEYKTDVIVKLIGRTLWVYLPLENIAEESKEKEAAAKEKPFKILKNIVDSNNEILRAIYGIQRLEEPPKEPDSPGAKYKEEVIEKINNAWKALRRITFSMEETDESPQFCSLIIADIAGGFEVQQVFYLLDLKKVSYRYISWDEYYHRVLTDTNFSPLITGDKEGRHLETYDISFEKFLAAQIQNRVRLKFEKPEVEKDVDIDKEIMKTILFTFKIYGFEGFSFVELNNMLTKSKTILSRAALMSRPMDLRY